MSFPLLLLLCLSTPSLAETSDSPTGVLNDAVRQFHAQELEAAETSLLHALETQPENAEVAFYLGRVYLAQGRAQASVEALERSTRLAPDRSAYHFWLGEALVARIGEVAALFKLGIANRMRVAYEKAVELDSGNLAARVAVARYHAEAPMIAGGDPAMVQKQLKDIRDRNPALAHVTEALIHEQLGRLEPAEQQLEAAVEVDPESVIAWREAGLFYQRRQRLLEAQQAFDEVLARQPADPVALFGTARAAIEISQQQLERAERALLAYLRLEPGPVPVIFSEGEPPKLVVARESLRSVYEHTGRPELAAGESDTTGFDIDKVRTDVPLVDAALVD